MKFKSSPPAFLTANCGAFELGAKTRMISSSIVWVSLLLTLAFASTGYSLPIDILNTQYTTTASITYFDPTTADFSRTLTATVPISDSLYGVVSGALAAEDNASLFGIYVNTPSIAQIEPDICGNAASATSTLWFSPLTSQTTSINIQFSGGDHWIMSAGGALSLLDVTSGNEVWNYGLPNPGQGANPDWSPWVYTGEIITAGTATLALDTDFNAGDIYELNISTYTLAQNDPDSPWVSLQLSGLEPVPEPSAFIVLGLGSLALAMVRRCR
jgi:hypothetical protein